MFNLIISIIAIALVVALAGASLYYGGDAFSEGNAKAKASAFVNQAQQIQAAATLYKTQEGGEAADIQGLIDRKYMASKPVTAVPTTAGWELETGYVVSRSALASTADAGITLDICNKINEAGSSLVQCFQEAATPGDAATEMGNAVAASDTSGNLIVGMKL